tara:strand:- start:48 stop:539 length:492 start_codon:yes stop_codon:yes gene_type:complete
MKKEINNMVDTKQTTPKPVSVLDSLPPLPSDVTTSKWFVDSVNNSELTNVGGKNWRIHLLECFDIKTKTYNVEMIKVKINTLTMVGQRPPSSDGIGNRNMEDYSDVMNDTKTKITTVINDNTDKNGVFIGKSGKMYKPHVFFREYVKTPEGKVVMKTTYKPKQ